MVDDQAVAITDCAPDDSQSTTAFQDAAGCETTFYHYLSSGQSYGAARWKYKFPGEPEIVLSECLQDNDLLYVHQVRIAGYENNDEALVSFPKTEIYIDTPNDKLVVSEAQVREGAAEIPYTFQKNMKVASGEIFFEEGSCEKLMKQNSVDRYLRGDGISTFDNILGEAESLNQGDGCSSEIVWHEDSAAFNQTAYWTKFVLYGPSTYACVKRRTVAATKSVVRDDSVVISTEEQSGYEDNAKTVDVDSGKGLNTSQLIGNCNVLGWPSSYPSQISPNKRVVYLNQWGWQ
jgi:hypothetical protein